MEWINVKDRKPIAADSPIIAISSLEYFSASVLSYIEDGWDGPGWYQRDEEYGIGLNEDEAFCYSPNLMLFWMPLPKLPEVNNGMD